MSEKKEKTKTAATKKSSTKSASKTVKTTAKKTSVKTAKTAQKTASKTTAKAKTTKAVSKTDSKKNQKKDSFVSKAPTKETKKVVKAISVNPKVVAEKIEVSKKDASTDRLNRLWWLLFFSLLLNFFFVFSAQVLNTHPFNQTPYTSIGEYKPGVSLAPSVEEPKQEVITETTDISRPPLAMIGDLPLSAKITTEGGQEFIFLENKTWIPYDGQPFEVVILHDETRSDDAKTKGIEVLKKTIHPAIIPSFIDVNSEAGQKIADGFGLKMTPSFLFGEGFDQLKMQGQLVSEHPNMVPYITKKGGLYFIHYSVFEENDITFLPFEKVIGNASNNEPTLGNGPVEVIEYVSFDDPDSQAFHSDYMGVIQALVRSNHITYIVKDRKSAGSPVSTVLAHQAANSVLKYVDTDAYLLFRKLAYDQKEEWENLPPEEAQEGLTVLAGSLNIDIKPIWEVTTTEDFVTEIEEDSAEAVAYNMETGKALFVNGQKILLTTPEALKNKIESMAQKDVVESPSDSEVFEPVELEVDEVLKKQKS